MEREELERILENHKKWLNDEGGEKANLRNANLNNANLRYADLRDADLRYADLRYANLRSADLRGADLREADLCSADLDFSCLPLRCGGLKWKTDKRLMSQLAYHFCSMECEDEEVKKAQNAILKLANQFHRVSECGELKEKALKE